MNITPRAGDLLYRQKGAANHVSVYLGDGRVLHHSPLNGVEVVSLVEFASDMPIKTVASGPVDIALLNSRVSSVLTETNTYQLFTNNCEHIANFSLYGTKQSPQVQSTIIGCIVGALIGRKMKNQGWLTGLLLGGLAGCVAHNSLRQYDAILDVT